MNQYMFTTPSEEPAPPEEQGFYWRKVTTIVSRFDMAEVAKQMREVAATGQLTDGTQLRPFGVAIWELRPIEDSQSTPKPKGPWIDYYAGCRVPKSLDEWCVRARDTARLDRFDLTWKSLHGVDDVPLGAIREALDANPKPEDSVDPITLRWKQYDDTGADITKTIAVPAAILYEALRFVRTRSPRTLEDHIDASAPMKKEPGPAPWGGLIDLLAKVTLKVKMRGRTMRGLPPRPEVEVTGTSWLAVRTALYVLAAEAQAVSEKHWRVDVDTAGSSIGWVYIDLNSVDDAEAERALSLLKRIVADVAARTASR